MAFDYFFRKFSVSGKEVYLEHYAMVKMLVPKERLLEYEVKDGWEPLCKFLDTPQPHGPFPNSNEKEETATLIQNLVLFEAKKSAVWFIRLTALCVVLYCMYLVP